MGDTLAELIAQGVSLAELIAAGFSIAELRAAGITAGEFNVSPGWTQIGQDIDGEAAGDQSGYSGLSLSADGSIVAIGARYNDGVNGTGSSHVRVYQNEDGTWTQIGQDLDGEAAYDRSGYSVSLSNDGSIVAIGAIFNNGVNGSTSGHVRVYQNVSGTWTQIGQDIDGEAVGDYSGWSVSLSADGSIVAIGAPYNDDNGSSSGQVRVYKNESGTWTQLGQDLDGETANDYSSYNSGVSLSAGGSIVAIGTLGNDGNGTDSGHVRVYQNESGNWTQIGEDIDGEAEDDYSGWSVSLSADGSIVAIGAPNNDGNGNDSGHVRVYKNESGTWTQIGQDIDGEAADDVSGFSVSLSADGSIVAIGARLNDGVNGGDSGHVRVYQNESGTWTQLGQDLDGEAAGDLSGRSVSLSNDGSIVAIGAPNNDGNGNDSGHVRVLNYSDYSLTTPVTELKDAGYTATELKTAGFTAIELKTAGFTAIELKTAGFTAAELIAAGFSIAELRAAGFTAGEFNVSPGWRQIGQDIDGEAAGDNSGHYASVSTSADGSIVAIGAPYNDANGSSSGHVRVYQNESGTWTKIGQDIDGEAAVDLSGISVSLSADGSIVAIGAIYNDGVNGTDSGHVRVYQNVSGTWTQIGQDIDGEAAYDNSGYSGLSLSADGSIVAIGVYINDGNGTDSGHVRVYQNVSGTWTQIGQDIDGDAGDGFGYSVSLSADGSIVAIGAVFGNESNSGYGRVYQNESGIWTQIGQDIDGEAAGDNSGWVVSLSADGSIVAIGAANGNGSNSGQVRVYQNVSRTWTQIGQDIDGEAANDFSGISLSISADGSIVAIGAYQNDGNGTDSGHVRVYQNVSGTWTQIGQDIDGEAANDWSGRSLSLSADGSIVAIGAPFNDGNGSSSGQVRVLNYLDYSLTTPVTELKDAGYTATELKDAGYTATELKDAGYTATELKAVGFTAAELKTAGFTIAELRAAGFTAAELVAAGFTIAELVAAGFTVDEIYASYLIDSNFENVFTLNPRSFGIFQNLPGDDFDWTLNTGGTGSSGTGPDASTTDVYIYTEASSPNYPNKTANGQIDLYLLGDGTFTFDTHMYGSTVGSLTITLYTLNLETLQIESKGVIFDKSGDQGNQWISESLTLSAGYSRLFIEGKTGTSWKSDIAIRNIEILPATIDLAGLISAGSTLAELKELFTLVELKEFFTLAELKTAGYTLAELKDAGFTATELKATGYTLAELKTAGFTVAELDAAGYTLKQLKNAGFTADLTVGTYKIGPVVSLYSSIELEAAGITLETLIAYKKGLLDIATAYPIKTLFTPRYLKATYTIREMNVLWTLSELAQTFSLLEMNNEYSLPELHKKKVYDFEEMDVDFDFLELRRRFTLRNLNTIFSLTRLHSEISLKILNTEFTLRELNKSFSLKKLHEEFTYNQLRNEFTELELATENIYNFQPPPPTPPPADFDILYSALNDPRYSYNREDYGDLYTTLSASDNWMYYNPNKNPNVGFALMTNTHNTDKLVVLKIDKQTDNVTTCVSATSPDAVYWNPSSIRDIWLDIKVVYTTKGDYAYMCTEGDNNAGTSSSFLNRVLHIYELDTLYENDTYSCINTLPGTSYHNLQTFQNDDVAYLYGVGGRRNALEIYDLSNDPTKPFYLGGYVAYPEGYNHTHEGTTETEGQLYIHDMQVSDQISGQEGKIIGFLACIYNSTIVVVDLSDPLNVHNILIIDDPRFKSFTYGLHHCWLTPNSEFLITTTEMDTNKTFVIDIKSIFDENITEHSGDVFTKYVGQFQLLSSDLGTNIHNQYCYPIKNSTSEFLLISAAYKSGTWVHTVSYKEIRDGLQNISTDITDDNLQQCLTASLRLKEDYESLDLVDGFDGVWSVSALPDSRIVFDSCYSGSLRQNPSGLRVFKANAMPEFGSDRQVPAPYDQIVDYATELIISSDPLSAVHPEFYRCTVRNPVTDYIYVVSVYDEENSLVKIGVLYGQCQYDMGNLSNDTNTTKNYAVVIKEYDETKNETAWTQTKTLAVEPNMYMAMNEYTLFNKAMFDQMHPSTTMPAGYDLSFTYSLDDSTNPQTSDNGYEINLSITSSQHKISFEELSLNDTPGWSISSPVGSFSCHFHYYTWEYATGQDSQGTNYDGYNWVKRGRLFKENWVLESKIKDMWVKIRCSSNKHGTVLNSDGTEVSVIFAVGSPTGPTPAGWESWGPKNTIEGQIENVAPNNNIAGATETVWCDPVDSNIILIGAVNGGIWKTTNAKSNNLDDIVWTSKTDELDTSITEIKSDVIDSNKLVAVCGRTSSYRQIGNLSKYCYISNDKGETWNKKLINTYDDKYYDCNSVCMWNDGMSILIGSHYDGVIEGVSDHSEMAPAGLYLSTDGGDNWAHLSVPTETSKNDYPVTSIEISITDTDVRYLYAGMLGKGIYRSADDGTTWTNLTENIDYINSIMTTSNNNILLSCCKSSQNVLYAIFTVNGIASVMCYTEDYGNNWVRMDNPSTFDAEGNIHYANPMTNKDGTPRTPKAGAQGAIHLSLFANPNDPNIVYAGGDRQPELNGIIGNDNWTARLFRGDRRYTPQANFESSPTQYSEQWSIITNNAPSNTSEVNYGGLVRGGTGNNSAPHADSRAMSMDVDGALIEVSDGGIYRLTTTLSNPTSQTAIWQSLCSNLSIFEIHSLAYDPVNEYVIVGTQDNGTIVSNLTSSKNIYGGDGGDAQCGKIEGENKTIIYSSAQGGGGLFWSEISNFTNLSDYNFLDSPSGYVNSELRGNMSFVPTTAINQYNPKLLLGSASINDDNKIISHNIETGEDTVFFTNSLTGADDWFYPRKLIYGHPQNNAAAFVLTVTGKCAIHTDSFSRIYDTSTNTNDRYNSDDRVISFDVDPTDLFKVYIIEGDRANQPLKYANEILICNLSSNGPDVTSIERVEIPYPGSRCIKYYNNKLYIGCSKGVYSYDLTTEIWRDVLNNSLPNSIVYDMILYENKLFVSTMGRGVFSIDL